MPFRAEQPRDNHESKRARDIIDNREQLGRREIADAINLRIAKVAAAAVRGGYIHARSIKRHGSDL